jgi:hypothetical protein
VEKKSGKNRKVGASKKQQLIEAAMDRILTHPLEGLRSFVNPSILSEATKISRDTSYKAFADEQLPDENSVRNAMIRAIAENASNHRMTGFDVSTLAAIEKYEEATGAGLSSTDVLLAVFEAHVEDQFQFPGQPLGWILQALSITSSPVWKGPAPHDPADRRLGRAILESRRTFYTEMTDALMALMLTGMSTLGRRPTKAMDERKVMILMHALLDGAALRQVIDPQALSSRDIAQGMLAIGMAFSEEGHSDPRMPESVHDIANFDSMVDKASQMKGSPIVSAVADEAEVPLETATRIFETDVDLADSVVWRIVLAGGSRLREKKVLPDNPLNGSEQSTEERLLILALKRLNQASYDVPGCMELLMQNRPSKGRGILEELEVEAEAVLRGSRDGESNLKLARSLVVAATGGTRGWATVLEIIDAIGVNTSGAQAGDH